MLKNVIQHCFATVNEQRRIFVPKRVQDWVRVVNVKSHLTRFYQQVSNNYSFLQIYDCLVALILSNKVLKHGLTLSLFNFNISQDIGEVFSTQTHAKLGSTVKEGVWLQWSSHVSLQDVLVEVTLHGVE